MHLELLSVSPTRTTRPYPLLFIHGAFMAAWCWEAHFLPFFAGFGYEVHALSLRGHGGSAGRDSLHWTGIEDYVADVAATVAQFEVPPVLIGHSMGGYVVQKYLAHYTAPAAVLMAAVPPQGLLAPYIDLAQRDPFLFHELHLTQAIPAFGSPEGIRRGLMSPQVAEEQVRDWTRRMQPESHRAVLEMLGHGHLWGIWPFRTPIKPGTPLLVMGGEDDVLFPPHYVRDTGRALGSQAHILPGLAHAMMVDAEWEHAALHLLDWLDEAVNRSVAATAE